MTSSETFASAVAIVFICLFTVAASWGHRNVEALKADAIERGYALYCPVDGKFAWVGECDE